MLRKDFFQSVIPRNSMSFVISSFSENSSFSVLVLSPVINRAYFRFEKQKPMEDRTCKYYKCVIKKWKDTHMYKLGI